ncbi:MAG: hypothetical protein IIC67_05150 [Thaumarchaeota archaeon]|nr:hypothetical protein [Nitrososphaerota archaeon]
MSTSRKSTKFLRWVTGNGSEYPTFHDHIICGKIPVDERDIPTLRKLIESMSDTELNKEFESAWEKYRNSPRIETGRIIYVRIIPR